MKRTVLLSLAAAFPSFACQLSCSTMTTDGGNGILAPEVNCDAYAGPRVGSWRSVFYPEGVSIDSAAVTEDEFFLLGGDTCFYCQENWLPAGASEWTSRALDDAAVRVQISDATPRNVVVTADFIGTSEISNHGRDPVQTSKFVLLERSGDAWRSSIRPVLTAYAGAPRSTGRAANSCCGADFAGAT